MIKMIPLRQITTDQELQSRVRTCQRTVREYTDEMSRSDNQFPPLVAYFDGKHFWLADGLHRFLAAKQLKWAEIACEVKNGGKEDAIWYSCSANKSHGLRRTSDDKAKAIKTALKHQKGHELADNLIAIHVGVDSKTVKKYRNWLEATSEIPKCSHRRTANGRTIFVENIGGKSKVADSLYPATHQPAAVTLQPAVHESVVPGTAPAIECSPETSQNASTPSKMKDLSVYEIQVNSSTQGRVAQTPTAASKHEGPTGDWKSLEDLLLQRFEQDGASVVRNWFESVAAKFEVRQNKQLNEIVEVESSFDYMNFDTP